MRDLVSGWTGAARLGTRDASDGGPTAGVQLASELRCLRCGFTVIAKPWGCKNPCDNCGFLYPLGDCSD